MSMFTPPPNVEDDTIAPLLIGVGFTLQLITASLVSARIIVRLRTGKKLQPHDWAVIVAEVSSIVHANVAISLAPC
jgi:hypothetical protein